MNTENQWKVGSLQPPGLSVVVGDEDVLSPAFDNGCGAIVWYWKQNVDGHRDLGFSIVCNYGFLAPHLRTPVLHHAGTQSQLLQRQ